MSKKLLKLNNVYKDYYIGEQVISVLKGIDLQINEGEFVSIMGHSGSGKSTLMNIIGLLDSPTSGEYFFDGKNVANLNSDQHSVIRGEKIGFIFQTYNLIARKSAMEQVMLPLAYQGISKIEREKRAKDALIKVGLEDKLYNKPNELSGGQQQRVAIARAIVINPTIILADEPTGALDTKTGEDVMDIITQLYKEGKTVILITHEQNIAEYAKRNILVKDGLIVNQL